MTAPLLARVRASVHERVRQRFGNRVVHREVLGAQLALPWSHRLPDYVRTFPGYGRNLIDLAEALHDAGEQLTVLDLGANVGDSAQQILARVDARVLCIDGDPYWLPFLRRNTAGEPRIAVEAALIVDDHDAGPVAAVRQGGTTRFVAETGPASSGGVQRLTAAQLRAAHPDFGSLRLIKSDVDGHDCRLVPQLARAWAECRPVLFFEYDPQLTRETGNLQPQRVWDELADLGYSHAAVWNNFGAPLGHGDLPEVRTAAAVLEQARTARDHDYWDVAVAASGDDAADAVLAALAPRRLSDATT